MRLRFLCSNLLSFLLSSALCGCSAYSMLTSGLKTDSDMSTIGAPQRLHSETPTAGAAKKEKLDQLSLPTDSAAVPIVNYGNAMRNAIPVERVACKRESDACLISSAPGNLEIYMRAGIGLVNDYCGRWFDALEKSEKRLNYEVQNDNVIKQLGTTLLGIGSANRAIVATYGAINTATAGFEDSFKGAFLFSPSANRARQLVKSALTAKEAQLVAKFSKDKSYKPSFIEVYNDLVLYGDICTDATARRLITDSVSATKASVEADGSVVVQPNVSRETVIAALTLKLAQTKAEDAEKKFLTVDQELNDLQAKRTSAVEESSRLRKLAQSKNAEKMQADNEAAASQKLLEAATSSLATAKSALDGIATNATVDQRSQAQKTFDDALKTKIDLETGTAAAKEKSTSALQAKAIAEQQADAKDLIVLNIDKQLPGMIGAVATAKKAWDDAKAAITVR